MLEIQNIEQDKNDIIIQNCQHKVSCQTTQDSQGKAIEVGI